MSRSVSAKALRSKYRRPMALGPFQEAVHTLNNFENALENDYHRELSRLERQHAERTTVLNVARRVCEIANSEPLSWRRFDAIEWIEPVAPEDELRFVLSWTDEEAGGHVELECSPTGVIRMRLFRQNGTVKPGKRLDMQWKLAEEAGTMNPEELRLILSRWIPPGIK